MTFTLNIRDTAYSVNLNDSEALSGQTWKKLFSQGRKACLPCNMITICHLETNSGKPSFSFYDTSYFNRYLQYTPKHDPLTRLPIKEIDYLFAKAFEMDAQNEITPCNSFSFNKFCCPLNERLQICSIEANNPQANEKDINTKETIAKHQFIIGANLLTNPALKKETQRWLYCSAARGLDIASQALKTINALSEA